MIFESGLKYEHMLSSEIEINIQIIIVSKGGSIKETSMEMLDTKSHISEHPHKGDMDIQPGMKLMGSRGPW